jgi:hypothetical protein
MTTPYYSDDAVTIYHGDCREIMPDLDFDVIVSDPPYGIAWKRSANPARLSKAHGGILNDEDTTARDDVVAAALPKPGMLFGSLYAPPPPSVRQILIWRKGDTQGVVGSTTGFRRDVEAIYLVGNWPKQPPQWSAVVSSLRGSWNDEMAATGHPHTKPIDLMVGLILKCPAGVILDPFMGSGTTLRAAKDLGRKAIGIELDEKYCEIAAKRMAQGVLDFGAAA